MPYASTDDLITRFGELELIQQTDLTGSGVVGQVMVSRALDDATGIIDGYVSSRYPLPLAVIPALLVTLCCDLVRYALYVDAAPPIVAMRRDQAIAQLRDIAAGRLRLDVGQAAATEAAPAGLAVVVQAGRKVFGGGVR